MSSTRPVLIKINDTKRGEKRKEKNIILKREPWHALAEKTSKEEEEEERKEKKKKKTRCRDTHRTRKRTRYSI